MQRRVIRKDGKTYIVNVPWYDDYVLGPSYGVGPGAPTGELWMQSTDLYWYSVNLTGTSGSLTNPLRFNVNQTPLNYASNELGFQLLICNQNGNVYRVYLSGSSGDVTASISQTPWPRNDDYKPYLLMKSVTDGYFYPVYAVSGSISLYIEQNNRFWLDGGTPPAPVQEDVIYRMTEDNNIRITEDGFFRII